MKVPKHQNTVFNTGLAFLLLKDESVVEKAIALKGTHIGERWLIGLRTEILVVIEGRVDFTLQHLPTTVYDTSVFSHGGAVWMPNRRRSPLPQICYIEACFLVMQGVWKVMFYVKL